MYKKKYLKNKTRNICKLQYPVEYMQRQKKGRKECSQPSELSVARQKITNKRVTFHRVVKESKVQQRLQFMDRQYEKMHSEKNVLRVFNLTTPKSG